MFTKWQLHPGAKWR